MRVLLHGFGGRANDFYLKDQCVFENEQIFAPELTIDKKYHGLNLWDQARVVLKEIKELGTRPRLVAYSMGARLAWHLLLLEPEYFRTAVVISGHPGLSDLHEIEKRLHWEQEWAHRWESDEWESMWKKWCELEVFGSIVQSTWGPAVGHRRWEDFSNIRLAKIFAETLRLRGLGSQDFLMPRIHEIKTPTLWVAGENDIKYRELGLDLKLQNSRLSNLTVPKAGHRALWDQTHFLLRAISRFELSHGLC
jgi:pimeloyl-ACP methyl ester carboxylesterase